MEPPLPGYYQYFWGVKCLAQGHNTAVVGFEPRPLAPESDAVPPSHHAPPAIVVFYSLNVNILIIIFARSVNQGMDSCCFLACSDIYLSLIMKKPAFCICKNKDADQLRGNHEADQRLCFRYKDSTIPLLPKSEISSLYPSFVAVQPGPCLKP